MMYLFCLSSLQYIEAISNKQSELENFVSDGYKTALTEERRRYCFLVEKQCAVAKNSIAYHGKGKDLLAQKIPSWQQSSGDPNKIPDRALQIMQQMATGPNGTILSGTLSGPMTSSKSSLSISDPIPGAKPLPVPPELAPFVGRMSAQEGTPIMNGVTGPPPSSYEHWGEMKPIQSKILPSQPHKQISDSYSNTLPARKSVPPKNSYTVAENKTLPRSSSMAAGLERNGRTRVQAIFSHAAGDNGTLLSFSNGDYITLLVPEARDGWHYGESEKTKLRGWFPFSYTRVLDRGDGGGRSQNLQTGKSSSTGNLLDKDDLSIPPPDYNMASRGFPPQAVSSFKPRPYSVAAPVFSQGLDDYGAARATNSDTDNDPDRCSVAVWSLESCHTDSSPATNDPEVPGNQGKHRVTKRMAALSNPMFTLVTILKSKKTNATYLPSAVCPRRSASLVWLSAPGSQKARHRSAFRLTDAHSQSRRRAEHSAGGQTAVAKTSLNRCHTRRFSDVYGESSDEIKFWPFFPDQRSPSRGLIAAACHTGRYR
ncbi:unnamed protein product [Ranitomeya imitator]|uniref:Brain-specific angiogenesis inhibitor 1-associated protein 2 n=1 Tax=Ranitomeya imitator TaxID=111125 RepID=A0ABN9LFN2_9NEOB|nr:unnamed protein product [Ranitomeya imitator]